MNEKDKEAFVKWYSKEASEILWEDFNGDEIVIKSWKYACDYKQKEIDELEKDKDYLCKKMENMRDIYKEFLKNEVKQTSHGISVTKYNKELVRREFEKLQAENAKLRECVEFYANRRSWKSNGMPSGGGNKIAIQIIKEDHETPALSTYGGKRARQVLKELDGKL